MDENSKSRSRDLCAVPISAAMIRLLQRQFSHGAHPGSGSGSGSRSDLGSGSANGNTFLNSSSTVWARIAARFDDEHARYHTALDYARECGAWAPSRAARREVDPQGEEPGPEFTVMGSGGGVLYLRERSHMLKFLSMYAQERDPPAISETLNGCAHFRAYLDLDFKSSPQACGVDHEFKARLVRLCVRAIKRFYPAGVRADAVCVSRPTKFNVSGGDAPTVASDGVHVIWPHVVVSLHEMAHIVAAVKHAVVSLMGERAVDESTNSWDSVFDMQVYRNGLRILGSCKRVPCPACAKIKDRGDDVVREVTSRAFSVAYYRAMAQHGDATRAASEAQQAAEAARMDLIHKAVGEHRALARGDAAVTAAQNRATAASQDAASILASQGGRARRFMHPKGMSCSTCHGCGQIPDKCPYEVDFYMDADESVNQQETNRLKASKIDAILATRIRQPRINTCVPPWTRPHDCPPLDAPPQHGGRISAAAKARHKLVPRGDVRYAILQQLVQSYDRRFAQVRVDTVYRAPQDEAGSMFTTQRKAPGRDDWALHVHVTGFGSGSCMNLNRREPHTTSKVYFVVCPDGIIQRCFNNSTKQDRIRSPCRKFHGPVMRLPQDVKDLLFFGNSADSTEVMLSAESKESAGSRERGEAAAAAAAAVTSWRLYGTKRLRTRAPKFASVHPVPLSDVSDGLLSRTSTLSNDSDHVGPDAAAGAKHTTPTPIRIRLISTKTTS